MTFSTSASSLCLSVLLVVLDSILNRITQNRAKGKQTFIFIDEIYLLFQHEYSANFLFTLWKRVRKYGAYATGITQNVDDLLQSHTARTMLANSEFIIMLNQASTDRLELAKLLNISDLSFRISQMLTQDTDLSRWAVLLYRLQTSSRRIRVVPLDDDEAW